MLMKFKNTTVGLSFDVYRISVIYRRRVIGVIIALFVLIWFFPLHLVYFHPCPVMSLFASSVIRRATNLRCLSVSGNSEEIDYIRANYKFVFLPINCSKQLERIF